MHILKLYITGASPNSALAIENIKAICEKHLPGSYQLQVVDVYQQPMIASEEQIIALPMLVKTAPLPVKKLVGNMSNTNSVLKGLDIEEN